MNSIESQKLVDFLLRKTCLYRVFFVQFKQIVNAILNTVSIFNQLQMIEDSRINQCEKPPLGYIPTTVFTATISSCSYWCEIEDYAKESSLRV